MTLEVRGRHFLRSLWMTALSGIAGLGVGTLIVVAGIIALTIHGPEGAGVFALLLVIALIACLATMMRTFAYFWPKQYSSPSRPRHDGRIGPNFANPRDG